MNKEKGSPILVTTRHKGIFFGYLKKQEGNIVELANARNCIYWSVDLKGFLGLAKYGPSNQCKIGPSVSSLILFDVTSVSEVTPEAVKNWEKAPWKS